MEELLGFLQRLENIHWNVDVHGCGWTIVCVQFIPPKYRQRFRLHCHEGSTSHRSAVCSGLLDGVYSHVNVLI